MWKRTTIGFFKRITVAPRTLATGRPNCCYQRLSPRFLSAWILPVLLLLLLALPAATHAEDYTYVTNNGMITITKYIGPGGDVAIPSAITDLPVTAIGDSAFYSCASLTNVTIPDSVTNLGSHSFRSCTSLTSVTLGNHVAIIGDSAFFDCAALAGITFPDSVASLEDYAFAGCATLTNVFIPKTITSIGHGAFFYCNSLRAITVDPLNPSYSSLDGVLCNREQSLLIAYPPGKGPIYSIPTNVTTIGDFAFYCCSVLNTVSIPNTVTNIGGYAFSDCSSLTNVAFPASVTSIGFSAFAFCSSLTSVTIPPTITSIGGVAFACCSSLRAITVHPDNPYYMSVDGVLFNRSGTMLLQYPPAKAGNYSIPAGVTTLGDMAFAWAASLSGISIPAGVTRIPGWAFNSCDSLTAVSISDTVASIGYLAFGYCRSLASVTFGRNVVDITDSAFEGCYLLQAAYFAGNVPSLGGHVFDYDNNLTVYYLPGTEGWGPTFGDRPTALWTLPNPLILSNGPGFGVHTNGFGFIISWATNIPVVVEACTSLSNSNWSPVATNTLTDGTACFSDPEWTHYPARLYRLRSP
jgi:hypothetical protein